MFEWDPQKNEKTIAARDIDFHFAINVWKDPRSIDVPARTEGEPRWAKIGQIEGKVYLVIYTLRYEKIRIISARRARTNEEKNYFEKIKQE